MIDEEILQTVRLWNKGDVAGASNTLTRFFETVSKGSKTPKTVVMLLLIKAKAPEALFQTLVRTYIDDDGKERVKFGLPS
jgi:hypothetical protein